MSTKGASNRYGNTRGGRQGKPTKHISYAWAKMFISQTLDDHFTRHGTQVGATSKESYNAQAVHFANTVDRKNCVSFIDNNNSTYKYNKKTNEFAIITRDGYVVTYFKPTDGYQYFLSQKKERGKNANRE